MQFFSEIKSLKCTQACDSVNSPLYEEIKLLHVNIMHRGADTSLDHRWLSMILNLAVAPQWSLAMWHGSRQASFRAKECVFSVFVITLGMTAFANATNCSVVGN